MPPVGFEPTISTSERPQTYALDRAATGTGMYIYNKLIAGITLKFILPFNFKFTEILSKQHKI